MDDVASARTENANLRKIQQKLLQWDGKDQALAPLTAGQLDALERLANCQDVSAGEVINTVPCKHKTVQTLLN